MMNHVIFKKHTWRPRYCKKTAYVCTKI